MAAWRPGSEAWVRYRLVRNSVLVVITTVLNGGLGFVYWSVAAHTFRADAVGVTTALLSAMTLASIVANFGLGPTLVQQLPRAGNDRGWSRLVNAALLAGAGAGIVIGLATVAVLRAGSAHLGHALGDPVLAGTLAVGTGALTVSSLLDYVCTAELAAQHILTRNVLFGVAKTVLLVVPAWLLHTGATTIVTSWVLASIVSAAWTLHILRRHLTHRHSWELRHCGAELHRLGGLLAKNQLISLGGAAIPYLMPLVVVTRLSATATAYFYLAWVVATVLLTVSPAVASALLAEASGAPAATVEKRRIAYLAVAGMLAPAALAIAVLGRPVLGFFGAEYARHSYVVLLAFLMVVVPDATTNLYTTVLRLRGHHGTAAVMNLLMAGIALSLAWVMLPALGPVGAPYAWAAAETVGVVFVGGHVLATRTRTPRVSS